MARRANWSRDQTLIALRLYCRTPFGRLHANNAEIRELAALLGRTPSAVAMKACNFARLDPVHRARGVRGLAHGSRLEEEIWRELHNDSESVADAAEALYEQLQSSTTRPPAAPPGPTEVERTQRVRRVQRFFRETVLLSYDYRCGLTGVSLPQLLNASHIIPWAADEGRRADPTNGICLNALHDRAFDRGLMSFDDDWRLVLSPRLRETEGSATAIDFFSSLEGTALRTPHRFRPSREALAYHRAHVFIAA